VLAHWFGLCRATCNQQQPGMPTIDVDDVLTMLKRIRRDILLKGTLAHTTPGNGSVMRCPIQGPGPSPSQDHRSGNEHQIYIICSYSDGLSRPRNRWICMEVWWCTGNVALRATHNLSACACVVPPGCPLAKTSRPLKGFLLLKYIMDLHLGDGYRELRPPSFQHTKLHVVLTSTAKVARPNVLCLGRL
jgi:hypothetical protein